MSASSPHASKNASQSRQRPFEEVLAAGGVGQHAVHVEHDGGPGVDRAVAPVPVVGSWTCDGTDRPRSVLLRATRSARSRISSTTPASASVVVSPRSRPSATSRSSRRMILPLRVLGRSGTTMTVFGPGGGADLGGHVLADLLDQLVGRLVVLPRRIT